MFDTMRYAVHGPCAEFRNAAGAKGGAIHGYQPICSPPPPPSPPHPGPHRHHDHRCVPANETDVYTMSCTQGWTCGNLVSTPQDVANFFFELLGPRSQTPAALLEPALLDEMLTFKLHNYFSYNLTQTHGEFGYGLGMMNFTSMYNDFDSILDPFWRIFHHTTPCAPWVVISSAPMLVRS